MSIDDFFNQQAESIGKRRTELHTGQASQTLRGKNTDQIAMKGEFFFAKTTGMMPNLKEKIAGDSGIDFIVAIMMTLDVKTSRIGDRLLHKAGKPTADLYVLVHYIEAIDDCEYVGWTTRQFLLNKEPRDTGCGIINHEVLAGELRPIEELLRRMVHPNRLHYATRCGRKKNAAKNH